MVDKPLPEPMMTHFTDVHALQALVWDKWLSCFFLVPFQSKCFLFQLFNRSHMEIELGACVGGFGFFGFALYPIALELGVECTFPVAEATSAGLLVISGWVDWSTYYHSCCNAKIFKYMHFFFNILSILWLLMAWCFSTRSSVATVLRSTQGYLWFKHILCKRYGGNHKTSYHLGHRVCALLASLYL